MSSNGRALLRKAGRRMLPVPVAEGPFESALEGAGSIGGLCFRKGFSAGWERIK